MQDLHPFTSVGPGFTSFQFQQNAAVPWVNPQEPMYKHISRHLRAEIERGRYKPGEKLPSVRTMVADFGVSHPTVLRALEELASVGYVKLVQGSGSYVSQRALGWGDIYKPEGEKIAPIQQEEDGSGESIIPVAAWQKCTRVALQEVSATRIERPPSGGYDSLKAAIASYVRRSRGIVADKSQVIITPGICVSLALISELCLSPGEIVGVEDPGSFKARRILSAQGAEILPIPLDSQGISIDALKGLESKLKLLHVTPNHCSSGTTMTETRRQSLLNWADFHKTVLVEDDFGSEYSLSTNSQSSLFTQADGAVIHIGGFWGSMHPLVQSNYVLLPHSLIDPALQSATLQDCEQNLLEQRTLEHMVNEGHLELALKRNKRTCMEKRALAISSLKQTMGARVDAIGTSVNGKQLLRFREDVAARSIHTAALRSGLPLSNTADYFVHEQPSNDFLLSFTSMDTKRIFDTVLHFAGLIR